MAMTRGFLLALGVICCLAAIAQAGAPSASLYSTRVTWKGDTCSGQVDRTDFGAYGGCWINNRGGMLETCDNSTGRVTSWFSGEKCSGEWYMSHRIPAMRCSMASDGPSALFCGAVYHPPSVSDKPIPQPVPGVGTIRDMPGGCDFFRGPTKCPSGTPAVFWYDKPNCADNANLKVEILFADLSIDKCYLINGVGKAKSNIQAFIKDGFLFFEKYLSRCERGDNDSNLIFAQVYPANRCVNVGNGASMKAVVSV